ncbi:hypothetical protein MHU86_9018 [Fragilaria crotonensis]|nr:hypothetical protein MHU86_9018 [Fragilaria crotonensis]
MDAPANLLKTFADSQGQMQLIGVTRAFVTIARAHERPTTASCGQGTKPTVSFRLFHQAIAPRVKDDLTDIAKKLLNEMVQRARKERNLDLTDQFIEQVRLEGASQAAQRFLEDSISDALVKGSLKSGDTATIDLERLMAINAQLLFEKEVLQSRSILKMPVVVLDLQHRHRMISTG